MPRRGQSLAVVGAGLGTDPVAPPRMRLSRRNEFERWVTDHHNLVELGSKYRGAVQDLEFWLGRTVEEDPGGASVVEQRELVRLLERAIARLVSGLDQW